MSLLLLFNSPASGATLYAVAYLATDPDPTSGQVIAGYSPTAVWSGNTPAPTTTQVFDWPTIATGLTAGTNYKVAFVWSDGTNTVGPEIGTFSTLGSGAVTHVTSGDLIGPGAIVTGASRRFASHSTSGVLIGPGAVVLGTATRINGPVTHATTGVLIGPGAIVTGLASRIGAAVTHETSGVLIGSGAIVTGQAQNGTVFVDTVDGFWQAQWKKAADQNKRRETLEELEDQLEEIEEQIVGVKAAPIPVRPVIVQSVPIPPIQARADLLANLIQQAAQIRYEIEEEETLLLLL